MSVWSDLKFSAGSSAMAVLGSVGYTWTKKASPIEGVKFISKPASKIVTARVAQQIAAQMAMAEVNKAYSRLQRHLEKKQREELLEKTKDGVYAKLIQNRQDVTLAYGTIDTSEGDTIIARDYLTRQVPEALIMSYKGDTDIRFLLISNLRAIPYSRKTCSKS